jgi:putative NIF3 family GTP cyclohydrolase 1 type 2
VLAERQTVPFELRTEDVTRAAVWVSRCRTVTFEATSRLSSTPTRSGPRLSAWGEAEAHRPARPRRQIQAHAGGSARSRITRRGAEDIDEHVAPGGIGRRLAVRVYESVSGAAADGLHEAAAAGLDAFLTGEPREHITAEAAEHHVHFVAAGHYATETFGVRALGELLADRFGVQQTFVDLPNPV